MKELVQFLAYTVGGVAAIFILIEVLSSNLSAGMAVTLGIIVVVVLPLIASIVIVKREKQREAKEDKG